MKISKAELEKVLGTLPIGYYAKRRIKTHLTEESDCSYYCPPTDEITISIRQIQKSMEKVTDESRREQMVRTNLYHELSHAILTPQKIKISDIINIFEDERIETLLADYYMDVNFKENVFFTNGYEVGKVPTPTTAMQAFYHLVRFRCGSQILLNEVSRIILDYSKLNRKTERCETWDYVNEIENLYREVAEDFEKNPESFSSTGQKETAGGDGKSEEGQMGSPISGHPGHGSSGVLSPEEIESLVTTSLNKMYDPKTYETFRNIITTFNKKNSGGSAFQSYSGVFNPRAVARKDYRYFDRISSTRGSNQFGTLHLNLFIDRSGSFYSSEEVVNGLMNALTELESQIPIFSMDIVFCGTGERKVTSPRERVLQCNGGNFLDDEIFSIFRSLQKPNTFNYNIALFDGDAFSDAPRGFSRNTFRAFDSNNSTIISDKENKRYIDGVVGKAKVIYTSDYTQELLKNVQTVLETAFR